MAKKTKDILRALRASIAAQRGETFRDFKTTGSQNEAIFDNLTRFGERRGRNLTTFNQRVLQQMGRLEGAMRQAGRRVSVDESRAVEQFGGLLAGATNEAFSGARVAAREGLQGVKAQHRVAKAGKKTAESLLGIAQAGAQEVAAAAEFETARALQGRTQGIAEQETQILMMSLQHQFDMEKLREQARINERAIGLQEEKAMGLMGEQMFPVVKAQLDGITKASAIIRSVLEDNPDASFEDAAARLEEFGLGPDQDQAGVLAGLFSTFSSRRDELTGGRGEEGRRAEVKAILDTLTTSMPDRWGVLSSSQRKESEKLIKQYLVRIYGQNVLTKMQAGGSGADSGAFESTAEGLAGSGVTAFPLFMREYLGIGK